MRARWAGLFLVAAGIVASPDRADAQYRNFNFGFEGGYLGLSSDTGLKPNNALFGIFGGWKAEDHWWFVSRAMLAFPGQQNQPNTVVLLHIVPVSVRYYFLTDNLRPFVGLTNSFQLLFNSTLGHDAFWGPGINGGVEIKLKRDLYLGFEADAFYMFVFQGSDSQILSITSQLIFFL